MKIKNRNHKLKKMEELMTIRLALSGAGYIANIHATAALSLPDVELSALVDFRPENTVDFRKKFEIKKVFTTIEDLVDANVADAVVICTPNFLHGPQAISALKGGLHVMVEKPMAINLQEALEMEKKAKEVHAHLMVAHCWRFDEEVQWLRKQVVDNKLGTIVRTKGYGVHANWGPSGWFLKKELSGGGALVDMGIHAIDTVRYLIGDPKPVRVYAHLGTNYIHSNVDDTGLLMIHWENDVCSIIECGWWQPHMDGPEASTSLYGTQGYGNLFPTLLENPNFEEQRVDKTDPGFKFPRKEHSPQIMYDRQMSHFIKSIQEDFKPVPGSEEGRINIAILDAAFRSAETRKVENILC